MRSDVVSIIEAAYRVGVTEHEWLVSVLEAARPMLDLGEGICSLTYDASNPERMRVREVATYNCPDAMTPPVVKELCETAAPDYVRDTWRSRPCELGSNTPGVHRQPGWSTLVAMGMVDNLTVNGMDPSGFGCLFSANSTKPLRLNPRTKEKWSRVAAHLGTGLRLRRRLAEPEEVRKDLTVGADAVLEAHGKVQHADGEATASAAREALRHAAVAIDRARGPLRRSDPEESVAEWKGLIAARWSLVDHFDSDGRRYLVARRNVPEVSGLDALTARERQVAAYAALGRSNKLIAYELGIADSTVRVLLVRAIAKLGLRSRAELVRFVSTAIESR
jgi:DNA-binding CsgD family transcriptional regulator